MDIGIYLVIGECPNIRDILAWKAKEQQYVEAISYSSVDIRELSSLAIPVKLCYPCVG